MHTLRHLLPAPRLPLHKSQPEGLKQSKAIFLGIIQMWASPKIQLWCRETALTDSSNSAMSFQL